MLKTIVTPPLPAAATAGPFVQTLTLANGPTVIGMTRWHTSASVAEGVVQLLDLYVQAPHQRKGHGGRLFKEVVAQATAESIRKVNEAIQSGGEAYFRYKQIEMLPDVAPFIADARAAAATWKPAHKAEKTWVVIAFIWCMILFAMMPRVFYHAHLDCFDIPIVVWMIVIASVLFMASVGPLVAGAVMLGLFLLGMLTRRANGTGAFTGAIAGTLVVPTLVVLDRKGQVVAVRRGLVSEKELTGIAEFLAGVDPDIPWHITAYHEDYKMNNPSTQVSHLRRAYEIGKRAGLRYIYPGNIPGAFGDLEGTHCPQCAAVVIGRRGFRVTSYRLIDGKCPECSTPIPGIPRPCPSSSPRTASSASTPTVSRCARSTVSTKAPTSW